MDFDRFDSLKCIALPVPTSFGALPQLSVPNRKQLQVVAALERSFTQQSGILPGTYTKSELPGLNSVYSNTGMI
jgi:hypothetical protein